ncbi:FkbM family methyltransferase [Roseicyclus mahoneyensis]|uniref:FkbM family methyltransferase n=2 Tax=Roseicyclus mahoneyensis TaxID=164332 RepID=A0A316G8H4_9RHOB|nr:FkbM family methyltransferase [Roseicyclus mahoneyensis]
MVMGEAAAHDLPNSLRPEARTVHEFRLNGISLSLPAGLATPEILSKLGDGTYEADEARSADRCVRPGFRVLELGAGIGYVTAMCAKRAGPQNVLSVEANPALIPVIEANLARNGLSGVTLVHGAATGHVEEGATADFAVSEGYTGSSLDGKGRAVTVPLISVHDLIRAHKPHVVLMDVEGAEADMFNRVWKCPLRFCVMELHPKKYHARTIKKIVDLMSAMDMTYDPVTSRGKILGFRKVWGAGDAPEPLEDDGEGEA